MGSTQGEGVRSNKKETEKAAKAAKALAVVRGKRSKLPTIIGVVVVLVVLAAVIAGVLYQRHVTAEGNPIPVKAVSINYPAQEHDGVVTVGKDNAKLTIDLYEDYTCPHCGQFEKDFGPQIQQELGAGALKVNYHMLGLLDQDTNPSGYSTAAANATLCVADSDASKFTGYHTSLFDDQPEEGKRGHSNDRLVELGHGLGINDPSFAPCVQNGQNNDHVKAETTKASSDSNLSRADPTTGRSGFGTPTVAVDDKVVNVSDPNWLTNLIQKGGQPT